MGTFFAICSAAWWLSLIVPVLVELFCRCRWWLLARQARKECEIVKYSSVAELMEIVGEYRGWHEPD